MTPTPPNSSTKSEPLELENGMPASPATVASNVVPVPGVPTTSTPLGDLPVLCSTYTLLLPMP